MGISIACVLHCLALPVLAAALPMGVLSVLAESHWHWLFVALAAPVSLLAVARTGPGYRRRNVAAAIGTGLLLLFAGALATGHDVQVGLTVAGALVLACAHLYNLRRAGSAGESAG